MNLFHNHFPPAAIIWITVFFRSVSQVLLQQNSWAGLLFLLGIGLNSVPMLVGGCAGVVASLAAARLFRCPMGQIRQGLFGYNGLLIGVAVHAFYQPSLQSLAVILAGAALSVPLQLAMQRQRVLPAYTAPFVLSVLILLWLNPELPAVLARPLPEAVNPLTAIVNGIGQIMLQSHSGAGLCFLLGIFVARRGDALLALSGSALGWGLAAALGFSTESLASGLFGYNGALTAIALWQRFNGRLLPLAIGIVLATLLTRGFQLLQIPTLTAPFVLVCWSMILLTRAARARGAARD